MKRKDWPRGHLKAHYLLAFKEIMVLTENIGVR